LERASTRTTTEHKAPLTQSIRAARTNPPKESHHLGKEATMLLATLFGSVQRYVRYRAQLSSVESLDDHMLYDIGLNRGELSAAAWAQIERATAHSPLGSQ
jgi:uncharacterized protein YjiS (DUF1127 family)